MRSKNWSLALAIMWTVCLFTDIVCAVQGESPSWTLVFCPLVCLVIQRWGDYVEAKYGN